MSRRGLSLVDELWLAKERESAAARAMQAMGERVLPLVPYERRLHWGRDYDDVWRWIRNHGCRVNTEVMWSGKYNPDNPLFMIKVTPVPPHIFPLARPTQPAVAPWHVSICHANDLQAYTTRDLEYVMEKFHNTDYILQIKNTCNRTGCALTLDPERDLIASDPIIQKMHSEGSHSGRD